MGSRLLQKQSEAWDAQPKKCCLGFVALQLGAAKEEIQERGSPETCPLSLRQNNERFRSFFFNPALGSAGQEVHKDWIGTAMGLNDIRCRPYSTYETSSGQTGAVASEQDREDKLAALFLANGHEIEFVD